MTLTEVLICLVIGAAAGVLGGLAGIGGSLIMLPALALLLDDAEPGTAQHLFMAAAMVVNVAVSFPAALRHHRARAIRREALVVILPAMAVAIVVGVLASNWIDGLTLRKLLAAFIAGYAIMTFVRYFRRAPEPARENEKLTPPRLIGIGGGTGVVAGLLGIGGGVLMVPLLQLLCRLPIRNAIATSSAVMVLTAIIGASLKLATLGSHGRSFVDALVIAAALAPTAFFGARLGAALTHRLPLQVVRLVVAGALFLVAVRMAGDALAKRNQDVPPPPSDAPAAVQPPP
ncbi:MAG: sulfite exporter TauE/SafE family protein [Planctomycetota bacterium]